MLAAVMRNHITWGDNGEQEPCLDIDVILEVTLEVCIQIQFSNTVKYTNENGMTISPVLYCKISP
jgi:hypothetical protein